MSTFALVHGAWHGGWCWDRLVPQIAARGHRAIAVDLPCEDPFAGGAEYAGAVVQALEHVEGDVVLVGHSLGGLTIPLVAAARPVVGMVFLCALLPWPGRSMAEVMREESDTMVKGFGVAQVRHEDGSTSWPEEAARETCYHDCAPEDATWAVARLRRQAWTIMNEPCPLTAWPAVACSYVMCAGDRVINPAWSRRAARERLGVEAIELPGGHSPFLSRPAVLADLLVQQQKG